MNFLFSENLIWFWGLPIFGLILWWGRVRRRRILGVLGWVEGSKERRRALIRGILVLTAAGALVLGASGPWWQYHWKEVKTSGADIVIALDISLSMMAEDLSPSRLERGKRKVIDFLKLLRGDRVGLTSFAGRSYIQCPLTRDYAAIRLYLDNLDPTGLNQRGTALAAAIDMATESLKKSAPEDSKGRAIVILSDGEDQDTSPMEAAERAAEAGIRLFTIGIGTTTGAPIPNPGGGFKKDKSGKVVITKLENQILSQLATSTGGMYYDITSGDQDIHDLYHNHLRKDLDRIVADEGRTKEPLPGFPWFAVLAALLLLVDLYILPW